MSDRWNRYVMANLDPLKSSMSEDEFYFTLRATRSIWREETAKLDAHRRGGYKGSDVEWFSINIDNLKEWLHREEGNMKYFCQMLNYDDLEYGRNVLKEVRQALTANLISQRKEVDAVNVFHALEYLPCMEAYHHGKPALLKAILLKCIAFMLNDATVAEYFKEYDVICDKLGFTDFNLENLLHEMEK